MWGNGYNMAWGWPVGLLMLVAVILLVVWIVRVSAGGTDRSVSRGGSLAGRGEGERSQARQILDDRFAKGELNETEYRERLKVLER
ncbi:SHOCT domain-containing protein [Cryobacterium cryoconiti]|uniref:SHOCT domain-containing protein n=2 Tax=Cryobacterium cryoconiti TaxID=1259239 RepID=A0A4Y8JZG2_9MICO|nr:SHOCT domain-containing protein [Cryobacterium cryoconiti]